MSTVRSHTESAVTPGSKWRNRKSGIAAEVVKVERDNVYLKREGMRSTIKWLPHFIEDYKLVTDEQDE